MRNLCFALAQRRRGVRALDQIGRLAREHVEQLELARRRRVRASCHCDASMPTSWPPRETSGVACDGANAAAIRRLG